MSDITVDLTRLEAVHLRGLVNQFLDLLISSGDAAADPAIARLVPNAYPDDESAAAQFRAAAQPELLRRRTDDAAAVLADLTTAGDVTDPQQLTAAEAVADLTIPLDAARTASWMRTLAAVRLVLASRLGITTEDDGDPEDPRFGVYEWLGYRLDVLTRAASGG